MIDSITSVKNVLSRIQTKNKLINSYKQNMLNDINMCEYGQLEMRIKFLNDLINKDQPLYKTLLKNNRLDLYTNIRLLKSYIR